MINKVLIAFIVFLVLLFLGIFLIVFVSNHSAGSGQEAPCPCDEDIMNCDDFISQANAQACFDFCMEQSGMDFHRLDNDGDGVVCEGLG